jgi:hypothetical protein
MQRPSIPKPKRLPMTITELVLVGGPDTLVRHAAADAAEAAARVEREFWLDILEQHFDRLEDFHDRLMCDTYIRELRRKLGIKPPKELIREQTRERRASATAHDPQEGV